jgi:hypothetical protein
MKLNDEYQPDDETLSAAPRIAEIVARALPQLELDWLGERNLKIEIAVFDPDAREAKSIATIDSERVVSNAPFICSCCGEIIE